MAKTKGFLDYQRQPVPYRPVEERIRDYREIEIPLTPDDLQKQAARCMDCGIPFCHGAGCPVDNLIPEFNDLVYQGRWKQACEVLHSTNNFPEVTGRVCPAPCETACTLAINDKPVLIRHIELQIVERGFSEGWIRPRIAERKSGKRVAVIGSGPAGLAAAQQLARAGHYVIVFERDERPGGLLRYGIPDFKLEKRVLDRRLEQMKAEGVEFQSGVDAGRDLSASYLSKRFDAICLTMGAGQPRDLAVTGRGYENIVFAMDFLRRQNRLHAASRTRQTISRPGATRHRSRGGDHRQRVRRPRPAAGAQTAKSNRRPCPDPRRASPDNPGQLPRPCGLSRQRGVRASLERHDQKLWRRRGPRSDDPAAFSEWVKRKGRVGGGRKARTEFSRPAPLCWRWGLCTSEHGRWCGFSFGA